jgi:hypothetical protein
MLLGPLVRGIELDLRRLVVGYAAQLCGSGCKQPALLIPYPSANSHQTATGDDTFAVDQQPFRSGTEMVKPHTGVEVRSQILPASMVAVGGREAIGVEQDQATCGIEEGVLKASGWTEARPLLDKRRL